MGKYYSWQMVSLKEQFRLIEKDLPLISKGEVLVKVAGCGVCHTDLSFWYFGVKTKKEPPLTLGHEISGTVVDGSEKWMGKKVIIPAVLPCGECEFCINEKSNVCRNQLMPGNDFDGGFASHVKIPDRFLCEVPETALVEHSLEELSVIADAVSTPYQVVKKSEMQQGDFAIVIGAGGVGIYGAQITKVFGAKVLAIDIDDIKLEEAKGAGIDAVLNSKGFHIKEIKNEVKQIAKKLNASPFGWKIFEISGTKAGQELAFALITFASTLSIVGFTMDKLELRLSNLMAFDAKAIGTWGCRAELYPEIIALVAEGKINIKRFTQTFPMTKINEVFKNTLEHKYSKRSVLVPDFE